MLLLIKQYGIHVLHWRWSANTAERSIICSQLRGESQIRTTYRTYEYVYLLPNQDECNSGDLCDTAMKIQTSCSISIQKEESTENFVDDFSDLFAKSVVFSGEIVTLSIYNIHTQFISAHVPLSSMGFSIVWNAGMTQLIMAMILHINIFLISIFFHVELLWERTSTIWHCGAWRISEQSEPMFIPRWHCAIIYMNSEILNVIESDTL